MQPAGDVLHEACGITGIYAPGEDVARLAYFGLYALQHRGQESAGLAVGNGVTHRQPPRDGSDHRRLRRGDPRPACAATSRSATRATRRPAARSSCNAQPFVESSNLGPFAFAHNGNLTNADELAARAAATTCGSPRPPTPRSSPRRSRSRPAMTWTEKIKAAMRVAEGAYSVVMCTPDAVYGFRDPWGVRPLCIGTYGDRGYMIASESCALATVGAHYLREIDGRRGRVHRRARHAHASTPRSSSRRRCACSSTSTSRGPTAC